jgi:hypothetical protein
VLLLQTLSPGNQPVPQPDQDAADETVLPDPPRCPPETPSAVRLEQAIFLVLPAEVFDRAQV